MVFVLKEALGTNFLRFQTSCPFFARKFIRHVILVTISNNYYNWQCLKYRVWLFSLCPQHTKMVLRGGNFGVSFLYMAWTWFLRWAFSDWCISLWIAIKMEKGVFLIFPVKDIQLAALLQNFKGANKYSSIFDSINFIGKGEAFHGLLFHIKL